MNHKILYRGKISGTKKWTTGTPFIFGNRCKMIHAVAVHPDFVDDGNVYYSDGFPVDIETVGQFTGCHDSTKWEELSESEQEDFIRKGGTRSKWIGKEIFEGDVIRYKTYIDFECCSVVKFGRYKQDGSDGEYSFRDCLGWYVEVGSFDYPDWLDGVEINFPYYMKQDSLLEVKHECKVIGNIHDNPELLRSSERVIYKERE